MVDGQQTWTAATAAIVHENVDELLVDLVIGVELSWRQDHIGTRIVAAAVALVTVLVSKCGAVQLAHAAATGRSRCHLGLLLLIHASQRLDARYIGK